MAQTKREPTLPVGVIRGTLIRHENAVAYLASSNTTVALRRDAIAERDYARPLLPVALRDMLTHHDALIAQRDALRDALLGMLDQPETPESYDAMLARAHAALALTEVK